MKKHNFSAGPSILPQTVLEKAAQAVIEYNNEGLSLIEMSHRSKSFIDIMERARALVIELMGLEGKGYKVLFLQGGASLQFLMTAENLLEKKGGYVNTGVWSEKAFKEALSVGNAVEVISSKDKNFNYIPKKYTVPTDLDYLHLTSNNTIFGTQIKSFPETKVPLIADMSSDIFSRVIDFSKFGLIYAGTQKNLGAAGATLVVIREDILGKVTRTIPSILNYKKHIENDSMLNTPSVFAVYTALLTLEYIKSKGGVAAIEKENQKKATVMYSEIDLNPLFKGFAVNEDRSMMNATFNLTNENLKDTFESMLKAAGISGVNGHRSVGGYRASMYNALPLDSVKALVEVMSELENNA